MAEESLLQFLWPKWNALWGNFGLPTVTAWFCLSIIIFVIIALIYTTIRSRCMKINYYYKQLSNLNQDELLAKRFEIHEIITQKEKEKKWHKLWHEFDETLVNIDGKLRNTIDAAFFFNEVSFSEDFKGSGYIKSVPAILTGAGVLGTFFGLAIGLKRLNFDSDPQILMDGIKTLAKGSAVAFTTSIWGVGTSIIYSLIGLILSKFFSTPYKQIIKLQNLIDELYPRFSAAETLDLIAQHTKKSNIQFDGLAEDIGNRMQQNIEQVSNSMLIGIEQSMKEALLPAIDKLVNATEELGKKQANQSNSVLGNISSSIISGISEEGEKQRKAFELTAENVKASTCELSKNMEEVFISLKELFKSNAEQQDISLNHVKENLATQNIELHNQQVAQTEMVTKALEKFLSEQSLQSDKSDNLLKQSSTLVESAEKSNLKLNDISSNMAITAESLHNASSEINKSSDTLSGALTAASSQIKDSAQATAIIITKQQDLISSITSVTEQLNLINNNISAQSQTFTQVQNDIKNQSHEINKQQTEHTKRVSEVISSLMSRQEQQATNTENLVKESIEIIQTFKDSNQSLKELSKNISASADSLKMASDTINNASIEINSGAGIISTSINGATDRIKTAADITTSIYEQHQNLVNQIQLTFDQVKAVNDNIANTANNLNEVYSISKDNVEAINEHQRILLAKLEEHVNNLNEELQKVLENYSRAVAEQTYSRLSEWDKGTENYTKAMVSVVETMQAIVEDMESKINK